MSSPNRDLSTFLDILLELSSIADITVEPYRKKELSSPIMYLTVNLFERVISRAHSLYALYKSYNEVDTSFAVGLVLRNAAADSMITIYIHALLGKGNLDELQTFAGRMLNDGRNFTKSYFAAVSEAADDEEFKKMIDSEIASMTSSDRPKGILALFKEVITKPNADGLDERRKDAAHYATDTYVMFSKLEHFGHETKIVEGMDEDRLIAIYIHRLFNMPLNLVLLHENLIHLEKSTFSLERQVVALSFLKRVSERFDEWYSKNQRLINSLMR